MSLRIEDPEELWRSVRLSDYKKINGKTVFSASAFGDRSRKPSVDAASIRKQIEESKKRPTDGIAKLIAGEIRSKCQLPKFDAKRRQTGMYVPDVIHRPIKDDADGDPDNPAHCQIECDPNVDNDGQFKRLKEALARLADKFGCLIEAS